MAAKKTTESPSTDAPGDEPGSNGPAESASSGATASGAPQGNRFFSWMRGTGIQRRPGWIGGVASGLGARLGVDPLIIRGVIVVIAVLGGPALLLYAAAWLLLPDQDDRIHAEDLGRGRFDPALIGIGVMVLLSMLPLAQGFWYAGAFYWGDLSWAASLGRVLWTAVVLTAIVLFVIWIAQRTNLREPTVMPATTDDKPDTIPTPIVPSESRTAAAEAIPLTGPPAPPPTPPAADAAADELQAWKEQQALWKQQHTEWKQQQAATERELREQRAAESRERALAAAARNAEERRLRRLANPRINAATVFSVLGAAILAGGISALVASTSPPLAGYEVTVALAVGAVVLGLGIVVAGLCRRRSGVLGFFAVLAILGLLVSAATPRDRVLLGPSWGIDTTRSERYAQPVGTLHFYLQRDLQRAVTVDIWQGTGTIDLQVAEGAGMRVELRSRSGNIYLSDRTDDDGDGNSEYDRSPATETMVKVGDEWVWSMVIGVDSPGIPTLRVWQGAGTIYLYNENITTSTDEEPTP